MLASGLKAEKLVQIGASLAQAPIASPPHSCCSGRVSDVATYQEMSRSRHGGDAANYGGEYPRIEGIHLHGSYRRALLSDSESCALLGQG
jgi:hypothetical protein